MPQTTSTFDSGTGSQTLTNSFDGLDLSEAPSLTLRVEFTKLDTDAADTCDVTLQCTHDGGTTWDDRIHLKQVLGDMTGSATAPEVREATIYQEPGQGLHPSVSNREPSGSSGGVVLLAGETLDGPFPVKQRTAASGSVAAWRVRTVIVDADSDADFEGKIRLIWPIQRL